MKEDCIPGSTTDTESTLIEQIMYPDIYNLKLLGSEYRTQVIGSNDSWDWTSDKSLKIGIS